MKQYNSMYLGICINNNDPEKRGRVQVFIPHIMPALYEQWNEQGEDIEITCVGDNMPDGLSTEVIRRLSLILPWAEAASPIVGTSSPGNLISTVKNAIQSGVQSVQKGIQALVFDQSPVGEPPNIQDLNGLFGEANKFVGNDARGSAVKNSWGTSRGPGNCLRGSQGILGALTGHPRFNAGKAGGLGYAATLYSTKGGQDFTSTGLYEKPVGIDGSSYFSDPKQWQVGDTVASSGGGKGYGHIQVWTGKAWVSDFTQNRILPASGSGTYGNFALHRPNAAGQAAIAQRAPGLGLGNGGTPVAQETTSVSGEVAAANVHQAPTPINVEAEQNGGTQYGSVANPNMNSTITTSPSAGMTGTVSGAGTATTTTGNTQVRNFSGTNAQAYATAKAAAAAAGSPDPDLSASIAMFESGHLGSSMAKRANNPFGQTITKGQAAKLAKGESIGNGIVGATYGRDGQPHAVYDSMESAMKHHVSKWGSRYVPGNPGATVNNMVAGNYNIESISGLPPGQYWKDGVLNRYNKLSGQTAQPVDGLSGEPPTPGMTSQGTTNLVNNTDKHGPVVTQNLNGMAKGLFTYPAAGSMLWVFFREGNPLYPVYFAASYSQQEWSSAYGLASDGPGYKPVATDDNPTISTGGVMNLNGVGGLRWESTDNPTDRNQDQKSIMLFGEDGSNLFMGKGLNQFYSKFDRRDQVEGDRWESTLGFKEEWTQGDSNSVVMGDVYVKIGNVSQPAVDAVQRIQEIITEIQKPLSESS
jgi:hypothetical protein